MLACNLRAEPANPITPFGLYAQRAMSGVVSAPWASLGASATFASAPWTALAASTFAAGWPWALCGGYIAVVFALRADGAGAGAGAQRSSSARPCLRRALQAWNLLLAVFSLAGACVTAPHLAATLRARNGVWTSLCAPAAPSFGDGVVGLWVALFIASKPLEMIDTAFLLAARRPVSLLHWFHHASVALFVWHSYATQSSLGLWFAAMNYVAHALMYSYYAATSLGYKARWPAVVTLVQTAQMFLGIGLCAAVGAYRARGVPCAVTTENWLAALAMYVAYAALFTHYALERYGGGARRGGGGARARKDV